MHNILTPSQHATPREDAEGERGAARNIIYIYLYERSHYITHASRLAHTLRAAAKFYCAPLICEHNIHIKTRRGKKKTTTRGNLSAAFRHAARFSSGATLSFRLLSPLKRFSLISLFLEGSV